MNVHSATQGSPPPMPRFDAKFIEDHRLIERYLENQLPVKGARDLEAWCRANPDYLEALKLSDRAEGSLRLLEACGRPLDLSEPRRAWWRTPYVPIALGLSTLLCLIALWALSGKYAVLRGELTDTRTRLRQGSLAPPATARVLRIAPDREPGSNAAKISLNGSAPQLMEMHIDMGYVKAALFRVIVDKQDQGRALILDNLLKDSNGELRLTVNTTGLSTGIYTVRIEALPLRGSTASTAAGWLTLEVH